MATQSSLLLIVRRAVRCVDVGDLLIPVAFAILYGVLATNLPILGPIFGAAVLLVYVSYLIDSLGLWARGGRNLGRSKSFARWPAGLKALLLLLPAMALVYGVAEVGPRVVRDLVCAVALFWLPASVLVLTLSDRVAEACNPRMVLQAIGALGADYLRVWLMVSVLMIAGLELGMRFGHPLRVYLPLLASMLSAALLGSAAFGRRDQLHHDVDFSAAMEEIDGDDQAGGEHEFLRRCRQIRRDQGDAEALEWLAEQVDRFHAPTEVRQYALELAAEQGEANLVEALGKRMIRGALEANEPEVALRAARTCTASVPGFGLGEMEVDDQLIELAEKRGRVDLLLDLCRNFNARYPRYKRSVDHAITASKLLIERYGRPEEARVLLEDAIARGAKDEQLEAVQALLRSIE